MDARPHTRQVFARFEEEAILAEMGRLLVSLLEAFAASGYRVGLYRTPALTDPDAERPYLRLVDSLADVTLVDRAPDTTDDTLYLYDREARECSRRQWRKRVRVRFDVFSSYRFSVLRGRPPILMPYPLHPLHRGPGLRARLGRCRGNAKRVRAFFSGDTRDYTRNRIHYPASKLTRREVVAAILDSPASQLLRIQDAAGLDGLFRDGYRQVCALVDDAKIRVRPEEWLERLSMADFFLCPPGFVMPMCHNVVEAMAVGTIPIINYPEWFIPSLRDMETCIAFERTPDLIDKMRHVLAMRRDDIQAMRHNVLAYYESHLDPGNFVRAIEATAHDPVTVLMITDRYVAENARKLNRRSFLLRDAPVLAAGPPSRPGPLRVGSGA